MMLTAAQLKVVDLEAVIEKHAESTLVEFATAYKLPHNRASVFILQTDKHTLEITWNQNRLTEHATVGGMVNSFLRNVVFTFAKPVGQSIAESRKQICRDCPLFDTSSTKCRSCGCYMSAKWLYDKSTCPLHKWQ